MAAFQKIKVKTRGERCTLQTKELFCQTFFNCFRLASKDYSSKLFFWEITNLYRRLAIWVMCLHCKIVDLWSKNLCSRMGVRKAHKINKYNGVKEIALCMNS